MDRRIIDVGIIRMDKNFGQLWIEAERDNARNHILVCILSGLLQAFGFMHQIRLIVGDGDIDLDIECLLKPQQGIQNGLVAKVQRTRRIGARNDSPGFAFRCFQLFFGTM